MARKSGVVVERRASVLLNFLVEHEHQTIQIRSIVTFLAVTTVFFFPLMHRSEREVLFADANRQRLAAFARMDRRNVKVFNLRGDHHLFFVLLHVLFGLQLG